MPWQTIWPLEELPIVYWCEREWEDYVLALGSTRIRSWVNRLHPFYLLSYLVSHLSKLGIIWLPLSTFFYNFEISLTISFPVEMMAFREKTILIQPINVKVLGMIVLIIYRMK